MADISKITIPEGNSTATYDLKDANALKSSSTGVISKLTKGSSDHLIAPTAYGECSTASSTTTKVATITGDQNITLEHGLTVYIRFDNTNTATEPYLNVQNTGAKRIIRRGEVISSGGGITPDVDPEIENAGITTATSWTKGELIGFTYNTTIDSNGVWLMHNGKAYSASSTSITPVTLSKTNLGSTDLTSNGAVTLQIGSISNGVGTNTTSSVTDYTLSLTNVLTDITSLNSLPIGGISGLTSTGQTVVTGITAS